MKKTSAKKPNPPSTDGHPTPAEWLRATVGDVPPFTGVTVPFPEHLPDVTLETSLQAMPAAEFCRWLQGYFELSGSDTLTDAQVKVVKEHLALVFTKVTTKTVSRESVKLC